MKYLKLYENMGFDLSEDKMGEEVYLIESLDGKYFINDNDNLEHLIMDNVEGLATARTYSHPIQWYTPRKLNGLNLKLIESKSYSKRKHNLSSGDSDLKKFNMSDRIKFTTGEGNWFENELKIEGWKLVTYFIGAYKL